MGPDRATYEKLKAERDAAQMTFYRHVAQVADASGKARADVKLLAYDHPVASAAVVGGTTFLIARLLNRNIFISAATIILGFIRAEGVGAIQSRMGNRDGFYVP